MVVDEHGLSLDKLEGARFRLPVDGVDPERLLDLVADHASRLAPTRSSRFPKFPGRFCFLRLKSIDIGRIQYS